MATDVLLDAEDGGYVVIESRVLKTTASDFILDALARRAHNERGARGLRRALVHDQGDGLTINGSAGSLNAVANYITQLKRSGYFQTVEIKESHQDDSNKAVQIFVFSLTAQFGLPQSAGAAPSAAGNAAPTANTPPAARRPGNI